MRIDLRDENRRHLGRIDVDPVARPTRVEVDGSNREVFLDWDTALDDAGRLRRCIACGCPDLYVDRALPQFTGLVVVLAFAGAAVGILGGGIAENPVVLGALLIVLILDVATFLFRRLRLVCYRCRTAYTRIDIARHHREWDRSTADRHPSLRKDFPLRDSTKEGSPP